MREYKSRRITITYSVIDLSREIKSATGAIKLSYLADGTLLSRRYGTDKWVTVDMGFTSYTYLDFEQSLRRDYVAAITLEDGSIERMRHEAGWTDSQGREVAALYDHRGSLRATWTKSPLYNTGLIQVGSGTQLWQSKVFDNLTAYYSYGLPFSDWQGGGRDLFAGKELERTSDLFTYDFHARRYDPQLGIFLAPDPMAATYPALNPYLYCAANPVSLTDPTGCTMQIADEKRNASYTVTDSVMLANKKEFEDMMEMENITPDMYTYQSLSALRDLYKSETARNGIIAIINSEHVVEINMTDKNHSTNNFIANSDNAACSQNAEIRDKFGIISRHAGSGGKIYWNPKSVLLGLFDNPKTSTIPYVSLGHEIGHAFYAIKGTQYFTHDFTNDMTHTTYECMYNGILKEEWQTVYFENNIRLDLGLPIRVRYFIPKNGVETTRMVNDKNQPINYIYK